MPSLDDVTQTFTADVGPYIASLEMAIAAADKFAKAASEAGAAAGAFGADTKVAAAMLNSLENAETMLMGVSNLLSASLNELGDAVRSLEQSEMYAYGATEALDHILGETVQQTASLAMMERLLAEALGVANRQLDVQIATLLALNGALGATAKSTVGTAATTAAAGGIIAQWWSQWGAVVHWVVMGTLEIAATAIPALIAFGAAAAGMAPTFTGIVDQMNYLRTITGSWTGVLANSVGPLSAVGAASERLRATLAPNAYIIFGAAINGLVGHVGAFSQVAQQAANVLSQFASKLSAELAGPLGGQLVGFFSQSVRFMTEWGAVLGNLGHIFVNAMTAFWGTSHLLLAVLVQITDVLVALTANPIVAWLIGLAGALSFVYRWGKLLYDAFKWMGGEAAFAGLKAAIVWVQELGASFLEAAAEEGVFAATTGLIETLLPELAVAALAITAALAIWATVSERTQTSTDKLISSVNKMPPTMSNLNIGFSEMSGNLLSLEQKFKPIDASVSKAYDNFGRLGTAVDQANIPLAQNAHAVDQTISEMSKLANQTVNLVTGMTQAGLRTGQVGAEMQVLAIQTAISDSKIQQLNQAIDQYMGIVTGGTAGTADFITALGNIGTVAASTSNNLGTSTTQMSLNITQFGQALSQVTLTGASAWQNFDQVLTGSAQPLADWFRTAATLGATTGPAVVTAVKQMAQIMGQYAGSNTTAQSQVLAFAKANGVTASSFQQLMAGARPVPALERQIAGAADQASQKLANLSATAKSAANAMNPIVVQAIDKAALQSSGFNKALTKLQGDMQNHAPAASIEADLQAVNNDYQTAIQYAERTGNSISTNASSSASNVHSSAAKMATAWDTGKLHQLQLQNQVMSSSGSIGSHTHSAASQTQTAMSQMSTAFDSAKAHAQSLQNYIDSMHGKSITVNTVFSSSSGPSIGSPAAGFGTVHPFHGGTIGYFQGGGIAGGMQGVDRVPAWLTKGEGILTTAAVSALGGPLAIRALNDSPSRAAYGGGGGGSGATSLGLNLVIQNKMDGQTVNTNQRQANLIYNRRNPSNNLALRAR